MTAQYIRLLCDIHCKPKDEAPRYRVYVDDELFTERTWIWENAYIQEALQINAPPGKYLIRAELVNPDSAILRIKGMCVDEGNAQIHKGGILEVLL